VHVGFREEFAEQYRDLTPGNRYRVLGIEADQYRILSDEGRPYLYPPELFDIVDASRPADWVVTVSDDQTYAYPVELGRPGFFEAYFDNDPAAIRAFRSYMASVFRR
jgi:hypothetical protein